MTAKTAEYLVCHGKTGALGRFVPECADFYARGDRVVLNGERGLSLGVVLCEATELHSRMLGGANSGQLLRRVGPVEEAAQESLRSREQQIFDASRSAAAELQLPFEIIDAELALDGRKVILQYLLAESCDPASLVQRLQAQFDVEVWLENLAAPPVEDDHHSGCGEPNCGQAEGGSGCTTCSTGGGCSSCSSGKQVDVKAYFAHLRDKMEHGRTALI